MTDHDHDPTVGEDPVEGTAWFDELTDEARAAVWDHGKTQAAQHLDELHGNQLGDPDADDGPCADCGHIAPHRWTLAQLELCRRCITLRHGARRHLAGEPARPQKPEPDPEPDDPSDAIEKVTFADVTEVLQARAALAEDLPRPGTNGKHTDDLWEPPDF